VNDGGALVQTGARTASGGDTINNWLKVAAPTAIATATPAAVVDSAGVSVILDVRDAATPVFSISDGGAVTQVGARTATGGDTINNWIKAAAPTAIATATPAAVVDSLGVSNILEVRDAATPVAYFPDGGGLTISTGLFRPSFADETITDGETLTPTYTIYALDAASAVTLTLAASASEGQPLLLIGDDNYTITISDTNIRTTDGNAATLGQYDAIFWVYQDSEWIHVAKSANQ
jgi:hypothetical protein